MQFKLDENIPVEACEILHQALYDCDTVLNEHLTGCSDEKIMEACIREDRILVTLDMDFADIRAYPPGTHPGIIVLRLFRQDKHGILDMFNKLVSILERQSPEGMNWILEYGRLRIRMQNQT